MVRRVCRELGNKKNIVVINDEAHHCYRHKPDGEEVKLKGDDRKEAEKREKAAHTWISGLEAVKNKIGIKAIYEIDITSILSKNTCNIEQTQGFHPKIISGKIINPGIDK